MTTQNIVLFIVVFVLTSITFHYVAALYWRGNTERLRWKAAALIASRAYASLKIKR